MLKGNNIILRAFENSDIDLIKSLRNNLTYQQILMTQPKANDNDKVLAWIKNKMTDPDTVFFIIADNNQLPIGYLQVIHINLLHRIGEIGIAFSQEAQGKGYFKEVMELIEKYLIDVFNLRKLFCYILENNFNSQKAFSRVGYKNAGILEKHFYSNKKFNDVLIMEKLLHYE